MSQSNSASMYGYSSTRVKAMESKLLGSEVLTQISKMDDVASMVGILLQTDYKPYIDEFGGKDVRGNLIDFALSKSLEKDLQKLIAIVPKEQKDMTAHIVGRSDAQNLKLVFYAKVTGRGFDEISKYVIESRSVDVETIKRAIEEQTLEGAVSKLVVRSPYGGIVSNALEVYKKTGNLSEVYAAIDRGFFRFLDDSMRKLAGISQESASVIRLDIDMRNVLTILRAKKYGMPLERLNDLLVDKGITSVERLLEIFESSKDVVDVASQIKSFDLKDVAANYESGSQKQMLPFEIAMRNQIFKKASSLLRHSMLSYGVIIGYYYLKEIEVFTLRILINGKAYGLSKEDVSKMIAW
jgi:V/A-type H+/Na+-transporting ATPase subunit C